ncbi:FecR domain-containing protein [Pseudomonas sp. TUM22785]|uniref:FecR domain-containing protein n=1 Tax=Pseudomonas sp. TUM22785 TaxID=3019098 RepID=UPI0023060F56|nr:FecR family protein [Pseudomonas sp. TUM22785]WCD81124.1 FecR family protein [Pseudomonas sp. TUM22785]
MSASSQTDAQVVRQAIHWLVRLRSASGDAELQRACEHWRAAHQDHEQAWQRVQVLDDELSSSLKAVPGADTVMETLETSAQRLRRRQALKLLSAAMVSGSALWLARDLTPWSRLTADYGTAVGERRHVALADGTQLHLNTDSAVDVRFDEHQRLLLLDRGEILVDSGSDATTGIPRPLRVRTRHGLLESLGGRFVVRQEQAATRLSVAEGAVSIAPLAGTGALVARAGQRFDVNEYAARPLEAADMDAAAWADGLIVTRGMRLADFLAEVSRYRNGRLACSDAIADLRLSGVYRLDDTDKLLELLSRTLPVEVHYRTRWWVTVQARA